MISGHRTSRTVASVAIMIALVGAVSLLTASSASAQAGGDNYKTLLRLGGVNRFDQPLKDLKSVKVWAAKKRTQAGITQVLDKAGLASLTPTVIDILTKADPAQLKETDFEPGGTMVWMAFRRGGGPATDILRNMKWGAKKPFQGFMFVIDDLNRTYTFILPKPCANLSLVSSEPSREKARLDAEKAARDKAEADRLAAERAAAERARLEAERAARAKAEADRLAKEKADAERLAREKAEAERMAKEKADAEKREFDRLEKAKFFFSPLFGKERRLRAGEGATASLCSPLAGLKFGAELKVNDTTKINPAVGFAYNFEKSSYTSLFAEVELNKYSVSQKNYFGFNFGAWDLTHSSWFTPSVGVQFGHQLWTNGKHSRMYFVGEGRVFLRKIAEIENNYMFWGGLRWVLR